jgi:murein DD-endopeptidase MepM/ murein hydrolase activator NlpD
MLVPAGASPAADNATQLQRTQQQISEIRKRLSSVKSDASAVAREVHNLDGQIGELDRQIRTGEHDISELESNIRSAEAKIAELQSKYDLAHQASNQRAVRLYKSGPVDSIATLLNADSIAEFVRMTVWWQVAAELDGKTMILANRMKGQIGDEKLELDRVRSSLTEQKKWLQARRALVADARRERSGALSTLERQIAAEEAHLKALEAESRRLTAVIRGSASRASGAVSTKGFIWPLNGRVSSGYGYRRGHFHSGIDIDGTTGQPIVASKSGVVIPINCGSGYGICTVIDHGDGVSTLYAHMSRKAVNSGSIRQGVVLGYVGCTGSCTGSHLHFEVRVNGEPRNPMNFLP